MRSEWIEHRPTQRYLLDLKASESAETLEWAYAAGDVDEGSPIYRRTFAIERVGAEQNGYTLLEQGGTVAEFDPERDWDAFMHVFQQDEILALCFAQYAIAKRLRDGNQPWPQNHPLAAVEQCLHGALGNQSERYFRACLAMRSALSEHKFWWDPNGEPPDDYVDAILARVGDQDPAVREYAINALAMLIGEGRVQGHHEGSFAELARALWGAMAHAQGEFGVYFAQLAEWLEPNPELAHLGQQLPVHLRGNAAVADVFDPAAFLHRAEFRAPLFQLDWRGLQDYRHRWLAVYVVGCIGSDDASYEWLAGKIADPATEPEVIALANRFLRNWRQ